MKKFFVLYFLAGTGFIGGANAGWASAVSELLGKASGKAVKVVEDVPIPKHAPDAALAPKPSFEPVSATEVNFNVAAQVGRVVARCKEETNTEDWRRHCEKKGEEMKICLTSETKAGVAKEPAEKKCGLIPKR